MGPRQPVRLGKHGADFMFERALGLHDDDTGIAVVGVDAQDPELLFEEHGRGVTCEYFEVLGDGVTFDESLGPALPRPDIAERVASDHWPTKFHALQAAFSLESAANVNEIVATLRGELEPAGGHVALIQTSRRLQKRKAMIRVQHSAQAQPSRPLAELLGEAQPLEEHSGGGDGLHHYLFTPAVLLASPVVRGFTTSRVIPETSESFTLVVLMTPGRGATPESESVSWHTVLHNGLPTLRELRLANRDWVATLNAPAADIPPDVLISWWTRQLNELLTEVTDLGRYRRDDGLLEARNAYRELRTLDRIVANCVRIQSDVDDHVGRVSAAFEFFDLLPNLLPAPVSARQVWGALADPKRALSIMESAFATAPPAIRSTLMNRSRQVTAVLRDETIKTVVPGRSKAKGVFVGSATQPLQADTYVAKLLHQLRNTHHGYELREQGQRDILDTHTGHISAAFPELVVLYFLALLSSPRSGLNAEWL